MDKQKIIRMAAQISAAAEAVSVAGEHNRMQMSGIYRMAGEIMAEAGREEDDGGQVDR